MGGIVLRRLESYFLLVHSSLSHKVHTLHFWGQFQVNMKTHEKAQSSCVLPPGCTLLLSCRHFFFINLHLECTDLHILPLPACLPHIALQTHFIAEKTEVSTVSPPQPAPGPRLPLPLILSFRAVFDSVPGLVSLEP